MSAKVKEAAGEELTAAGVVEGRVAWIKGSLLKQPPVRCASPNADTADHPFLCYKVTGERSCWTPLTSQGSGGRLHVPCGFRKRGDEAWRQQEACFLVDGKQTFRGPTEAFIAACDQKHPFTRLKTTIAAPGLQQIGKEIRAKGGFVEVGEDEPEPVEAPAAETPADETPADEIHADAPEGDPAASSGSDETPKADATA